MTTQLASPPRGPAFAMSTPPASAGPGLGMNSTGDIRLAAEHFAAAMLFLIAGSAGLVWVAPQLAAGLYLSPNVAGVTHLFTLGWLTTTIFGALYQLLPVALGSAIRWPKVGHASFVTFVPGTALFAAGVATGSNALHHVGIALLATGVVLAIANFAFTLAKTTRRDVTWYSVAIALGALASTLVLGVILLHNLHAGHLGDARLRVLATHLHIALVGWALIMMLGMSQRLLPMFLLAHGVDARWSSRALVLLSAGTVIVSAGLIGRLPALTWTGAVSLAAGVSLFLVQSRLFFKARMRRKVDVGMRFAATGLIFLAITMLFGILVLVSGADSPRIATVYILTGLLGGIVLFVVGHFYKIVPFLAWIARFRGRVGKEKVPVIADLFSARVAMVQWVLMTVAVLLLSVGTLAGHGHCARVGALLFASGVVLFSGQVIRLAWPLRREVR